MLLHLIIDLMGYIEQESKNFLNSQLLFLYEKVQYHSFLTLLHLLMLRQNGI